MRKSKYDQSSLPVQNSKDIDKDNNISKIENRACKSGKSDRGHQSHYPRIETDKSICR